MSFNIYPWVVCVPLKYANEMFQQQVRVPFTNPDDLSGIPGIHMTKMEKQKRTPANFPLTFIHTTTHTLPTHVNVLNQKSRYMLNSKRC